MNRQKYVWNEDYRNGYDDGVKDGREQIQFQLEYIVNDIETLLHNIENIKEEKKDA